MTSSIIAIFLFTIVLLIDTTKIENETSDEVSYIQNESQRHIFFTQIKDAVIKHNKNYGLFPSVTLAQAALESNFGQSQLAKNYFNLFGVKGNEKNGALFSTKEFVNDKWITINDYFKIYNSFDESIEEHSKLLAYGTTWNKNQYAAVLNAKNYQEAAYGLIKSGYATDPTYDEKLIKLIKQYHLTQYDNQ